MRVLFSPVGTADPMTQLGDGPLLHIVRHYKPEKVVLFLSPAMAKKEAEDNRYTKALALLDNPPEVVLQASEETEVFRFDRYIAEFEEALEELQQQHPQDELLVNVSSGTAGMLAALVSLGSFGRIPMTMIQVTTPAKGINGQTDREDSRGPYPFDELWELNPDNEPASPCRCIEVETPNFAARLIKEKIAALVKRYDYEAAYVLAQESPAVSERALELLRAARDRLNLNWQLAAKVFGGTPLRCTPNEVLAEYLPVMEVRLKQEHWKDMVLSLSPALFAIMEDVLEDAGCPRFMKTSGREKGQLDRDAIRADAGLNYILGAAVDRGAIYASSDNLFKLVEAYRQQIGEKYEVIADLRAVEQKCRNGLAHSITGTERGKLENLGVKEAETFKSFETMMERLYEFCPRATPGLYDRINEVILQEL